MELPKQALEQLEKLRKMKMKELRKEEKDAQKILKKIPDKKSNIYKSTKNLLFLIDLVKTENKYID